MSILGFQRQCDPRRSFFMGEKMLAALKLPIDQKIDSDSKNFWP